MLGKSLKTALSVLLATAALGPLAPGASGSTLYTNNYNEKQLAAFSIGSDGLLTPLAGSPFPIAYAPQAIGITPDGRFMVANYDFDNLIGTFSLGSDGTPSPASSPLASAIEGAPAISPDGRFVYVSHKPSGLDAYAIGGDGSLTKVGGTFGSATSVVPAVTPDGHFLLAPDYKGGAIERFAIQPDGSLASLGATPVGFKGPYVIRVTPDGRLAIVLNLPESSEDELHSFAIGADGSLTPTGFAVGTGGGATGPPAISPDGRFLFAADRTEKTITVYTIAADGAMSQVGLPGVTELNEPRDLGMSVDGRFLYAEPQSGLQLQAFAVAADGALSKVGGPTPTGGSSDDSTPVARPSAPVASFTVAPGAPRAPTSFDASGSSDTGGRIVAYDWNFGDGTTSTTTDPRTTHDYASAGVYEVKLSVSDDNGCHGFSFTGQTAYCGGRDATVSVDTPPAIYSLVATPATFSATAIRHGQKKSKPGTTFHYELSEDAAVTFAILRKVRGLRVGGACKPLKGKKRRAPEHRCVILHRLGSIPAAGKAGRNKKRFPGRLEGEPLKPGSYLAKATAVDSAGGVSSPRSTSFKVRRR